MLELSEPEPSPKNGISITLLVIGIIIYVGGFFAGIIMGENSSDYFSSREFDYVMMFSIWINAFISGTLFLGFAEIIKLLHNLNNKKL